MKDYWKLEERLRAELTEVDLESYLTYDLMAEGLVEGPQPPADPVDSTPQPTRTVYVVEPAGYGRTLAFDTYDQVQQFLTLQPMTYDFDYPVTLGYVQALKCSIKLEKVFEKAEYDSHKVALKQVAAIRKANTETSEQYKKNADAIAAVENKLRDDWRRCVALRDRYWTIKATFEEYFKLCDGVRKTAQSFLRKAYSEQEITAAIEWVGFMWLGEVWETSPYSMVTTVSLAEKE